MSQSLWVINQQLPCVFKNKMFYPCSDLWDLLTCLHAPFCKHWFLHCCSSLHCPVFEKKNCCCWNISDFDGQHCIFTCACCLIWQSCFLFIYLFYTYIPKSGCPGYRQAEQTVVNVYFANCISQSEKQLPDQSRVSINFNSQCSWRMSQNIGTKTV